MGWYQAAFQVSGLEKRRAGCCSLRTGFKRESSLKGMIMSPKFGSPCVPGLHYLGGSDTFKQ